MNRYRVAMGLAVVCLLSACSAGGTTGPGVAQATSSAVPTSSAPVAAAKALRVVESGFGGTKEYVWVTALVHNDAAKPGDFVISNFNLKDASGQIITSESQTEQFYKVGQDLALGTQASVPAGKTIASVEVTVAISNNLSVDDTPELTMGPVTISESYGSFEAAFEVTNPTGAAVTGARIGIICKDASGKINGGGDSFPDLVPPNGKTMADGRLLVSAKPASCKAYYGGVM